MKKINSLGKSYCSRKLLYLAVLAVILVLVTTGCQHSTHLNYAETRINDILYNIRQAFNNHDIDALMTYFHYDYLHDGYNKWEIEQVWLDRMAEYLLIDFQNVQIDVYRDEAVVSFTMKLQNQTEAVYYTEPAAHGDLSFFYHNNYDWYVYGNRHYYKKQKTER